MSDSANAAILQGDCLDLIQELYLSGKSMRQIADDLETNHKLVSRRLKTKGVITRPPKPEKSRLSKIDQNWRNMEAHIRYDVDLSFLKKFNFERLKVLNCMIKRDRIAKYFDTTKYIEYIIKFHDDPQFLLVLQIHDKYKNRWSRPSLDHLIPISKGGTTNLDNLQILTWFENRTKCDMNQLEWTEFLTASGTSSKYFICGSSK